MEQDSKQNQKAVIGGNRKANCLRSQAGSTFSVAVGPSSLLLGCLDDLFLQSSAGTFLPGMGQGVLLGFGWIFKIMSCYISSDSCMPKSKTMFSPYIKYFASFSGQFIKWTFNSLSLQPSPWSPHRLPSEQNRHPSRQPRVQGPGRVVVPLSFFKSARHFYHNSVFQGPCRKKIVFALGVH